MTKIGFFISSIAGWLLIPPISLQANSVYYNFDDTIHSGVVIENAPASVNDGALRIVIDEASQKWTARLFVAVNVDIFDSPFMMLRYKVGAVQANTTANIAVTIKIDELYTKNGDPGTWRLYPELDLSYGDWQDLEIDLSPLISSWESTNGSSHGNIQEIRIDIGTNNGPYLGEELFLDYIRIGDMLRAGQPEINPFSSDEILVDLGVLVSGTPAASSYSVTRNGIALAIDSVFILAGSGLVVKLVKGIDIPRDVLDLPALELSYNGNDEIKDTNDVILEAFQKDVSFSAYAENLWKYWGKFEKVDIPYQKPWMAGDTVLDGWDWSLPDFVEADELAYFRYKGRSNLDFSCKNLNSVHVSWNELEPSEGQYNFNLLRQRIIDHSRGYDGVVLRVLASVWKIDSYPTPGGYVPDWLAERENAPRWMDNLDIEKIQAHKAIDGKYIITNMDIMDPGYHSRYQKFVEELGKSGIPEMGELKIVNVCYRSASAGEEFTAYNPGRNPVEARYSSQVVAQRTRERLKAWADAFGDQSHKLMYVGHDTEAQIDYAGELGIGSRHGFIEMYNSYIHLPFFGITINPDRYVDVDENNHFIKKDLPFGDENEEYSNELRFGWKESFPYRYYVSSFRMLQMRRNYVMHSGNTLNPELTWYTGMGLSRKIGNTPDAFALLSEYYISEWANQNEDGSSNAGPVKNVERWLYQRDVPGYETTPAMKVPTAKDLWYADNTRPYDFTARRGRRMGFALDDRMFPPGEQHMAIKLSFYDGFPGTLKLVYRNNDGMQEDSVAANGNDIVRTATFFIRARMDADSLEFDFELHSEEEVPVFFVRVIKTEPEYRNTDQSPYGGKNRSIPGFIEGEHYDEGRAGYAYQDDDSKQGDLSQRPTDNVDIVEKLTASNGYSIGYTNEGEWLEYTVDVTSGVYDIILYYFCGDTAGDLVLSLDGEVLSTFGGMVNRGWEQRDSISLRDVPVNGGSIKILRLEFVGGAGFEIDALKFSLVKIPVSGISITECPPGNLTSGNSYRFRARVSPTDATDTTVHWISSDLSVAKVDSSGLVTAVSGGYATISVVTNDGGFTAQCNITVDSTVGVNPAPEKPGNIEVYPNPASEILFLRFPDSGSAKIIRIYNSLGQILLSESTFDSNLEIDVRNFNSQAMFIVHIISGYESVSLKVFIAQ
jgi:hypothetical protein